MNNENSSKLWKIIQEAGDYLMVLRHSLVHSSYADNLNFIKNKLHKDSLKTSLKPGTYEINQMVNDCITINKIYSQIWVPLKIRSHLMM